MQSVFGWIFVLNWIVNLLLNWFHKSFENFESVDRKNRSYELVLKDPTSSMCSKFRNKSVRNSETNVFLILLIGANAMQKSSLSNEVIELIWYQSVKMSLLLKHIFQNNEEKSYNFPQAKINSELRFQFHFVIRWNYDWTSNNTTINLMK